MTFGGPFTFIYYRGKTNRQSDVPGWRIEVRLQTPFEQTLWSSSITHSLEVLKGKNQKKTPELGYVPNSSQISSSQTWISKTKKGN